MVDFSVKKVSKNLPSEQAALDEECLEHSQRQSYAQIPTGLMSKQCTAVTRAYACVDNLYEKPVSLKDYIEKLKRHNAAYETDASYGGNTLLNIKNRRGQTVKTLHYDGGTDAKNLSCYEVKYYSDNSDIPVRETGFDINSSRPRWINKNYKNAAPEIFTKDRISARTTPQEYVKKLEAEGKVKNKDFFIERQKNTDKDGKEIPDSESIFIRETDPSGTVRKSMWWYFDPTVSNHVAQSYHDKDGFMYRRITFDPNGTTSVCDYYDK